MDEQLPAEYSEALDPDSAIAKAGAWLTAVLVEQHLAPVWDQTDENLRVALAQSWVSERSFPEAWRSGAIGEIQSRAPDLGLDDLAAGLADLLMYDEDPLWPEFEAATLRALAERWSFYDHEHWGVWDESIPLAPGLVVVYFVDPRDRDLQSQWSRLGFYVRRTTEDRELPTLPLVLRWSPGGWLVAGFSQAGPPTPGWPPSWPSGPRPT